MNSVERWGVTVPGWISRCHKRTILLLNASTQTKRAVTSNGPIKQHVCQGQPTWNDLVRRVADGCTLAPAALDKNATGCFRDTALADIDLLDQHLHRRPADIGRTLVDARIHGNIANARARHRDVLRNAIAQFAEQFRKVNLSRQDRVGPITRQLALQVAALDFWSISVEGCTGGKRR